MKKLLTIIAALMIVMTLAAPAMAERPNITAHKLAEAVIDGKLDEWNLDSPAVVEDPAQVIRDVIFWQGPNDCSA